MPVALAIDTDRRIVRIRADGDLTLSDVITLRQAAAAGTPVRHWPLAVDASAIRPESTLHDLEAAIVAVLVALDGRPARGRVALIAPDRRLYRRLLTFADAHDATSRSKIRVFRHAEQAEVWLVDGVGGSTASRTPH